MRDDDQATAALIELERLILEHKARLLRGGYDDLAHEADKLLAVCRRAMGVMTYNLGYDKPSNQTTREPLRRIADRRAQAVMARIADAQMKTWDKFPPVDGPIDFIRLAILQAMEDAGVKL